MSTEQTVDQQTMDQTRQQIRALVSEIAKLAKSDLSPREFYTEFLNRVVSAMAGTAGAVWLVGEEGRLELEYQINLVETRLLDSPENQARHGQLLHKVLSSGQGSLMAPYSGSDDDGVANPTEFMVVLGPLKNDQQTQGVVEVFQRPNGVPTAQRGYLQFVLRMCELASDYVKTRRLRDFTDRQALWLQLETFTRAAHASLDPRETAYTIANEGRRLIDCDRVSVAIRRGSKCHIEAISGQDLFDKRSNTVALLNRLATAVVRAGEPIWYTGDTSDMPPQVEEAVQAYVDDSHSKTVAVLPLKRPLPSQDKNADPDVRQESETIGALIVEQIEDRRITDAMLNRVDVVSEHSSSALSNALEHQSLFLMPVWRALGKATWVVKARTLPKTLTVLGVLLAVVVALAVVPADFDLKGNGSLQPRRQRDVFAAVEGVVKRVPVEHGDLVKQGDVLVEMYNTNLEFEERKLLGERSTTLEQLQSVEEALRRENLLSKVDITRFRGDQAKLRAALKSLDEQLKILEQKKEQLSLTSPIDGQVVTWDLDQLLRGRSVERGQLLVTVADPAADWQLEVLMPEDRMRHVTQAQLELGKELPVRYILATDPRTEYRGQIVDVHYSAEVRGDEGNTVIVRVSLDPRQLEPLRACMIERFGMSQQASQAEFQQLVGQKLSAGELSTEEFFEKTGLRKGAQVRAKVHCGRASVGYVWLHDAINFVHRTWFTIF